MNPIADHAKRIASLEAKVNNLQQEAIVTAVHQDKNLVDVEVRGVTLTNVPYMTWRAGGVGKTYWTPEVDESGLLLCPDGQVGNAIFAPGLNTTTNPAPLMDTTKFQMLFGTDVEINIGDTETEIKRDTNHLKINDTETEIKRDSDIVKIDGSEIEIKHTTGAVNIEGATSLKNKVGMNEELLNAIALNVLGALIYPTGLTTLQSPAGPVMFAPAPTPPSVPAPPTGTPMDAQGNITGSPPTQMNNVVVRTGSSLTCSLVVATPIPVVTPGGPGTIAAGTYPISLTITGGTLQLTVPSRSF